MVRNGLMTCMLGLTGVLLIGNTLAEAQKTDTSLTKQKSSEATPNETDTWVSEALFSSTLTFKLLPPAPKKQAADFVGPALQQEEPCVLQWPLATNPDINHRLTLSGSAPCYFFGETLADSESAKSSKTARKIIIPKQQIDAIYLIGMTPADLSKKQREYYKSSGYCTQFIQALLVKQEQIYLSQPQKALACTDDTLDEKLYFSLAEGELQPIDSYPDE